jgi:hypothetical protein
VDSNLLVNRLEPPALLLLYQIVMPFAGFEALTGKI